MKRKNKDRYFFTSLAIWFSIITLLGFLSTFYIPDSNRNLDFYLNFHGFIFSFWILFYFIQNILISIKNPSLHMKLGFFGLGLSVIIFLSGVYTSFMQTSVSVSVIGDNFAYICTYLIFVLLGIKNRKKLIKHKRYMVFATTILTSAAVARINVFGISGRQVIVYYFLMFLPIILLFVYDLLIKKKIYRVNIFNTIFIFIMLYTTNLIWETQIWSDIVHKIVVILK